MREKFEIDYYEIEGSPGGSQDWCSDFWMNLGGCAALAAGDMAICLSRNYGLSECCPYDPDHMTKEDYDQYAMILKPYIRPRFNGVTRLSIFTSGFQSYLRDRGFEPEYKLCPGDTCYEEAGSFVKKMMKNLFLKNGINCIQVVYGCSMSKVKRIISTDTMVRESNYNL